MNYLNLYTDFLQSFANLKKPLKVIFDCSNGTAGLVLKKLKIPNSKFIILNSKVDGCFPAHGPDPTKPNALTKLQKEVVKQKADLGAAFDGDADRVVFIDDLGRIIPVFAITRLISLKEKPPYIADGYVAKTLKYLNLLQIIRSPVGTYFMKKTMKKYSASFGAELSGHYYFKEIKNADSGILATIKVMNVLSELPYKMSQFYDLLPEFYFKQWNASIKNTKKLISKIKSRHSRDWIFIVRPSNTEPLVRFFGGSKDKKLFQKNLKKLKFLLPL